MLASATTSMQPRAALSLRLKARVLARLKATVSALDHDVSQVSSIARVKLSRKRAHLDILFVRISNSLTTTHAKWLSKNTRIGSGDAGWRRGRGHARL